ncbi:hypothetical protein pb186bvf_020519 [Paramecium bursaria]
MNMKYLQLIYYPNNTTATKYSQIFGIYSLIIPQLILLEAQQKL